MASYRHAQQLTTASFLHCLIDPIVPTGSSLLPVSIKKGIGQPQPALSYLFPLNC